jgi:hypothetical protein
VLDECKISVQYIGFEVLARVSTLWCSACNTVQFGQDTSDSEEDAAFFFRVEEEKCRQHVPLRKVGTHQPHYVILHSRRLKT